MNNLKICRRPRRRRRWSRPRSSSPRATSGMYNGRSMDQYHHKSFQKIISRFISYYRAALKSCNVAMNADRDSYIALVMAGKCHCIGAIVPGPHRIQCYEDRSIQQAVLHYNCPLQVSVFCQKKSLGVDERDCYSTYRILWLHLGTRPKNSHMLIIVTGR